MLAQTLFLSILIALITEGTCEAICDDTDCVIFFKCPYALTMARNGNNQTHQLLRQALCGMENRYSKICCSFLNPNNSLSFNRGIQELNITDPVTVPAVDKTDHPNLDLLPDECGVSYEPRILMGRYEYMYELPWMALISYHIDGNGYEFKCSGTIINSRYILTAAYCVAGKSVAGVRIGEYDLRHDEDCEGDSICETHIQDLPIEDIIYHKDYSGYPEYLHDIAVIRLRTNIDFNYRNAAPICLPVSKELREKSIENKIALIAGWGLTEHYSKTSILLKAHVPIRSVEDCQTYYSQFFSRNLTQFCAGNGRRGSCRDDSGGPLMLQDLYKQVNKYIQFGIVSNSSNDCVQSPGIYTDVRKYVDWILDNIKN